MISPESPEVVALTQMAGVDPARFAAAFNDPVNLFTHISLVELQQLQQTAERLTALHRDMQTGLATFNAYVQGFLAARQTE